MRTVLVTSYLMAATLLACVDPAPAPSPVRGSRSAGTKSGVSDEADAASPHAGDKEKQKSGTTASALPGQSPSPASVPAPPVAGPWTPQATGAAPQSVAASQSPPADNLSSVLSSLVGIGAGALGGASLGGFLGDLIGNQQLGTLLGSLAGATLGGGLAQGTQDPTK